MKFHYILIFNNLCVTVISKSYKQELKQPKNFVGILMRQAILESQ